ncbi:MAG: MFS transporter [Anaerolineaceae bacterium]|nr:MFS transporter [Anaerolineaceae bacterium]
MANNTQPNAEPINQKKFHFRNVLAISAAHATHDTYTGFLPPLLPIIIENLSITKTTAGLLTIFMRIPSLFQPLIGYLADHYNLRIIVILAPAITAALMSMVGVAPNVIVVALLVFLTGVSSASIHAVAPVITGRLSGTNLGRGMSFWMVGGEFGRVLGPLMIVLAIEYLTLKHTPWVMILGLITSLMLYFVLKDIPVEIKPKSGASTEVKAVLKKMGAFMLPMMILLLLRSLLFSGTTMFLPTFLIERGEGLFFSGAALSVLEGAGIIGALLGGSVSDKWGRKSIITFSILFAPLFTFLFLRSSGYFSMLWLALLGFSMLCITPPIMAMVQENFKENRSLANGLFMALNFITSSIGVFIVGKIGDNLGLQAAIGVGAISMLISLPLVFFLPKSK